MTATANCRDISIEISTFLLKTIGLWAAENPADDLRRKITFSCTSLFAFLSVLVEATELHVTWIQKGDIFYVVTNVFTVGLALTKVYMIRIHKKDFTDLIMYVREKFLNVSYESQENEIVNNCRRVCTFFVCCVTIFGFCVMMTYLVAPYVGRSANDTERILPFKIWVSSIPLTETPYYEITFFLQMVTLYLVGLCYFCFDNIFCIMAIHLSGQLRVLQYRFNKLCDIEYQVCEEDEELMLMTHADKSYEKFKTYVRQHQNLIRCCNMLEKAEATPARRSIFVFLLILSMFLLFMFTYSCDCVIEQSDQVAVGAYSALWTIMPMNKSGRMLRNDLILVIERSRRVCCLTANGFFPVSLETYTTILSTAVSYFTLLQNRVEDKTGT